MTMQTLRNFTESEKQEFYRLVAQLEAPVMHPDAKELAKRASNWFSNGNISEKDKEHLRSWCKDSQDASRAPARKIARKISVLVFKKEIKTEYD